MIRRVDPPGFALGRAAGCDHAPMVDRTDEPEPMTLLAAGASSCSRASSRGSRRWAPPACGSPPSTREPPIWALAGVRTVPVRGYLMATRRPENSLSWLMLRIGAHRCSAPSMGSYAGYAFHGGSAAARPGSSRRRSTTRWGAGGRPARDIPPAAVPDGHLPSPRWRWLARLLAAEPGVYFLTIVFLPREVRGRRPGVREHPEPARRRAGRAPRSRSRSSV